MIYLKNWQVDSASCLVNKYNIPTGWKISIVGGVMQGQQKKKLKIEN